MANPPKISGSSRPRASRPELKPLDEHLAALLNPALTRESQDDTNARNRRISGRSKGFGEAPQETYKAEATITDPELARALGLPEMNDPAVPHRGDRVRDKAITRDAILADAPRRVKQGNVKPYADQSSTAEDPDEDGLTGATATMDALKSLLQSGDPRFIGKTEWTPHRPARPEKSEGGLSFEIVSEYQPAGDQPHAIAELVEGIQRGERDQVLLGVTGSGKTFTAAQIIAKTNRPALILAPNKTLAAQLYGEFKSFFPHNAVEYFVSYYDYYQPEAYVPRTDTFIEKESTINEQIDRMRHAATRALLERDDVIIVASVSCIYGIGSVETYTAMTFSITVGESVPHRQLIADLVALQYKRSLGDFVRGSFRVRGDVIELFPAHYEDRGWRISMFGDEVESIVEFDPLTGNKTADLESVKVYANSHYVTPRPTLLQSIKGIKDELKGRLDELIRMGRLLEAQRLEQRTLFDLEMLEATGVCQGIENYSRYLTGRKPGEPPPTLFEYLPDNALVFTDESHGPRRQQFLIFASPQRTSGL